MFSAAPIAGRVFANTNFSKLKSQTDNPMVTRVVEIATAANCPLGSVDVIEPRDQAQTVEVSAMSGRLSITRRAIDELSDKALDFGIAYASRSQSHTACFLAIFAFIIPMVGIQTFVVSRWVGDRLPGARMGQGMFISMIPLFVLMFVYMNGLQNKEAKRQIREALQNCAGSKSRA